MRRLARSGIFIIAPITGPVGDRIAALQGEHDPRILKLGAPHVTIAGSSGVGPIAASTPVAELEAALGAIAASTAPIPLRFGRPTKFMQTEIVVLPLKLAHEIVSIFYNEADAVSAEESFIKMFQQKESPDEMPDFQLASGQTVLDVILAGKLSASKSEARRLIDQKGVRLDGEVLERGDAVFPHPGVLQVGKRKFLRVK